MENCIIIGENIDLLDKSKNRLIVKGKSTIYPFENISIDEIMSEREYYLISSALRIFSQTSK